MTYKLQIPFRLNDSLVEGFGPKMCNRRAVLQNEIEYPRYKKGQITIINLLVLFCVALTFYVLYPTIAQFTTAYALPAIAASSMDQSMKDVLTALVNMFPIVLFIGILITSLTYAIPRREGQGLSP